MPQPQIIAHRGAALQENTIQENTIAAFERAIALGADGVEFDVRATQDQVLIIHHDPTVNGQLIQDLTWQNLKAIAPEIPTLQETVACCQGRIFMDIELKAPGYEAAIVQQLQHLSCASFAITSFHLEVIAAIRQIAPQMAIGFLVEQETVNNLVPEHLRDSLQNIGVDFIAPAWQILDTDGLAQISPPHVPLWVWTVNQPQLLKKLLTHPQIAAIITDCPDLALKLRSPGLDSV